MEKLLLIIIGILCVYYIYRRLFKTVTKKNHCQNCGGCCNLHSEQEELEKTQQISNSK